MTDFRTLLGKNYAVYAARRAVLCRNSKQHKDLAFPLSDVPQGGGWKVVGLVDLPTDVRGTVYDRVKAYNERVLGVKLAEGQVFGV